MSYTMQSLSDEVVYITWHASPAIGSDVETQFMRDIQKILDEATVPQYFLSDLRRGRIGNVKVLHRLSKIADHPLWGGGASFSQDPLTSMFVEVFAGFVKTAAQRSDGIFNSPEEAIAHLDSLRPGLAESIQWATVIPSEANR